jgi:cytochrome c
MYHCRVLAALLPYAMVISACGQQPGPSNGPAPTTNAPAAQTDQARIERGKQLVTFGGCHDCHSPKKLGPNGPEPDMDRALSGHPEDLKITGSYTPAPGSPWTFATNDHFTAWSGPWGISFTANLTPDTNTGLRSGVWTEELFIKALRTGKHMGTARDILPPMPWPAFASLSDDDLRAIWAYLGTLRPITNHVPDPIPPVSGK